MTLKIKWLDRAAELQRIKSENCIISLNKLPNNR